MLINCSCNKLKIFHFCFLKKLFGCAGSLLQCGLFCIYGNRGPCSSVGVQAPRCSGFSCCRALGSKACRLRQLQHAGSAVVGPELSSTRSVLWHGSLAASLRAGIFPAQGWNPCLLRWQADSPPEPPGMPSFLYFWEKYSKITETLIWNILNRASKF